MIMDNFKQKIGAGTAFLLLLAVAGSFGGQPALAQTVRPIAFPVIGPVTYYDDFGADRVGHQHEGNDLMGRKMMPLVAAADGTITFVATPQETWGYSVSIRDSEGWSYRYIHMNNDTPGTDDGKGGEMFAYAPDVSSGRQVTKGQLIGWMGDSGNAEGTTAHLHFEVHPPNGAAPITPFWSLNAAAKLNNPVIPPAAEDETLPYMNDLIGVSVAAGNFDSDSDIEFSTGTAFGNTAHVKVFNEVGSDQLIGQFVAYIEGFKGGVDIAAGDVDGDGMDEIITAAGPGGGPHIKIFEANGTQLNAGFYAYDSGFAGGVNVAAADVDGDGRAEIITAPVSRGGPHVKIFEMDGTQLNAGFYAYDPNFSGGVDVAAMPASSGRPAMIVTGAGPGGGPHVRLFDVNGNDQGGFFAYEGEFSGGVRVSAADVRSNANGYEIAVVPASNRIPEFKLFDVNGTMLDDATRTFDSWWIGGYDIAAGHGQVYAGVGGEGATGPVGRRASIREVNFGDDCRGFNCGGQDDPDFDWQEWEENWQRYRRNRNQN